jgi:hypothetical protein
MLVRRICPIKQLLRIYSEYFPITIILGWRRGAVSSLLAFPSHILPASWGGFFTFGISDPHFAGVVGRFLHFWHFRPTFCRRRGAVSSLLAFPPHFLPTLRGGFFTFCISDPLFVSIERQLNAMCSRLRLEL